MFDIKNLTKLQYKSFIHVHTLFLIVFSRCLNSYGPRCTVILRALCKFSYPEIPHKCTNIRSLAVTSPTFPSFSSLSFQVLLQHFGIHYAYLNAAVTLLITRSYERFNQLNEQVATETRRPLL